MPTFGGVNIFGYSVTMARSVNPRGDQKQSFPGVSGVESLDQGLRGRNTVVQGRLFGSTTGNLAVAEALAESYVDGNAYVLVDKYGVSWANVKLESFKPVGRVEEMRGIGYHRKYEMVFFHLT